jgi:hypothetical protein
MPYRTATPRPARIHSFRVRPALAFVVPLAITLVALIIARGLVSYPSMASVVSCSQHTCTAHHVASPGAWREIPCADADAEVQGLLAPVRFVWHRIYTWEFTRTHEYVWADAAREHLAGCVAGRETMAVVYVADLGLSRSLVALGGGVVAALAFVAWARTRGLHLEIDEGARVLRWTERPWFGAPREGSCPLGQVAYLSVGMEGHLHGRVAVSYPLVCRLSSGTTQELLRTRYWLVRCRYSRLAYRANEVIRSI